MSFLNPFEPVY
jgi:omega-6 fatty acid desaturase (delta-12 desaturase)